METPTQFLDSIWHRVTSGGPIKGLGPGSLMINGVYRGNLRWSGTATPRVACPQFRHPDARGISAENHREGSKRFTRTMEQTPF